MRLVWLIRIGKILGTLEEIGELDNTLIILQVTMENDSDYGLSQNASMMVVQIPFIIRYPKNLNQILQGMILLI